jgi:glyoxylase I family protein
MTIRYVHTNLVAMDWKRLAGFYRDVFGCTPVLPERDLSGDWIDRATGLSGVRIRGIHLRLPGHGESGPTLEIFSYDEMPGRPDALANTPGIGHIAFAVEDVAAMAERVFAAGGTAVGERVEKPVPGVGLLTFQYLRDPEGNILELQRWQKEDACARNGK